MTDSNRRAFLGRMLAGAVVAAAGASLVPTDGDAGPPRDAVPDRALPEQARRSQDMPVAGRTTCMHPETGASCLLVA
ncbi:MAG: hypothetical protein ACR650_16045 [Methylocystis sp.]|jgi:hypothetical protein